MWQRWANYWNRGVILMILVNLSLVFFNLSYISLRWWYLDQMPRLVEIYDPIKGIEPSPTAERYLETVDQLNQRIGTQGLEATQTAELLANLRQQSQILTTETLFASSQQERLFAELQRRIQVRMQTASATDAWIQFWQTDYLQQTGWPEARNFLTSEITPLLSQTYYHRTREMGQPVDNFWKIDLAFMLLFGVDFLIRTWLISRERKHITWGDAIARRWYEFPLFFPFWRWMRLLPAAVRLHRTNLVNVERLIGQATHEPAAYLSDRVMRFALVQVVNQARASVEAGTLFKQLSPTEDYTEIGRPGKLEQVGDRLLELIVYSVIPHIKPDLKKVLQRNLNSVVMQSNLYEHLQQIPGFSILPATLFSNLSNQLAQAACDLLIESYNDTEGRVLLDQLSQSFRETLSEHLQKELNSEDIKVLISDWLEEIKLNYIQQATYYDPMAILEEAERYR
ncbi:MULTISPECIES: hypothetical protein [unclassified Leptolyngbya]|uniref:hypothetical protein n=1 Tax=unclassified Leptolyngbya TaxID=2650499 RepID=UPI00168363E8|nr:MULTISPECIES: hypothetical protein [unclassified Leptolyngbya]MBD1910112.1 hypothetical protein [Leptolyngbya sp. FACHB-8]MBD2156884.1 hypothetical protein [Leptolyngbya sp. FACHB-16]